jgi:hypothetical protein
METLEACKSFSRYCGESSGTGATSTLLGILAEFTTKLADALDKYDRKQTAREKKLRRKGDDTSVSSDTTGMSSTIAASSTNGQSLVVLVNDMLKNANSRTIDDFKKGRLVQNPTSRMQAIYEREQVCKAFGPLGSKHKSSLLGSIKEQGKDDDQTDLVLKARTTISNSDHMSRDEVEQKTSVRHDTPSCRVQRAREMFENMMMLGPSTMSSIEEDVFPDDAGVSAGLQTLPLSKNLTGTTYSDPIEINDLVLSSDAMSACIIDPASEHKSNTPQSAQVMARSPMDAKLQSPSPSLSKERTNTVTYGDSLPVILMVFSPAKETEPKSSSPKLSSSDSAPVTQSPSATEKVNNLYPTNDTCNEATGSLICESSVSCAATDCLTRAESALPDQSPSNSKDSLSICSDSINSKTTIPEAIVMPQQVVCDNVSSSGEETLVVTAHLRNRNSFDGQATDDHLYQAATSASNDVASENSDSAATTDSVAAPEQRPISIPAGKTTTTPPARISLSDARKARTLFQKAVSRPVKRIQPPKKAIVPVTFTSAGMQVNISTDARSNTPESDSKKFASTTPVTKSGESVFNIAKKDPHYATSTPKVKKTLAELAREKRASKFSQPTHLISDERDNHDEELQTTTTGSATHVLKETLNDIKVAKQSPLEGKLSMMELARKKRESRMSTHAIINQ